MSVHINWVGPTEVIKRKSLGERWCFRCRKRTEFEFTVTRETGMSYHDPWPSIHCIRARHINGDLFPGYGREWDED